MASILVTAALFVLGLVLAVAGFLLFRTALYGLGLLLGLSVGLAAFASGSAGEWGIVVLIAAPLLGVALAAVARLLLIAVPGAVGGAAVAAAVTGTSLTPVDQLSQSALATIVAGALVGMVVAYFLETAIAVVVTASWGASLVSLTLGAATFDDPANLAQVLGILYWGVFAVGVVAQVSLWYYLRQNLDDDEDPRKFLMRRAGQAVGSLT
jgi:hypothetical protein